MKIIHLGIALAGGAVGYQFARARHRKELAEMSQSPADDSHPKHYVSKTNPREPVSTDTGGTDRTGSGLNTDSPRPAQTSDWYGHDPKQPPV